ncbi:hypothetical protein GRU63_004529 [Salmonella enterica]|nr:hypothetical protein [Salmonella enterica]
MLRIHAARGAGISTARSQCAAPGRTRDGRLFRSCPASLLFYAIHSPFKARPSSRFRGISSPTMGTVGSLFHGRH